MLPTLTGDGLDKMNQAMIKYLKVSIDGLEHKQQIDLLAWCRDSITVASTDAIYGAANPYRDPKMAQAFWYVLVITILVPRSGPVLKMIIQLPKCFFRLRDYSRLPQ
jgi:hypothetical protein